MTPQHRRVGKGAKRRAHQILREANSMSCYRRAKIAGGVFFFTVALADRSSDLLVREIDRLRRSYKTVQERLPFETLRSASFQTTSTPFGNCRTAMPITLHAGTSSNPAFSRGLPAAEARSDSKVAKREKGIWQRCYWEHTIRDDRDFERHVDYIHYDPVSTGWWRVSPTGRTAVSTATSRRASCRTIGAETSGLAGHFRRYAWARRSAPLPILRLLAI